MKRIEEDRLRALQLQKEKQRLVDIRLKAKADAEKQKAVIMEKFEQLKKRGKISPDDLKSLDFSVSKDQERHSTNTITSSKLRQIKEEDSLTSIQLPQKFVSAMSPTEQSPKKRPFGQLGTAKLEDVGYKTSSKLIQLSPYS